MSAATKPAANRANAALSTGPADTSRTRFNGLAHGLTSKQTVIRGEDPQEYDAFHTSLHRDLDPCSPTELVLAERIIAAAWRLKRFARVEAAFFNNRIDAFLEANHDSDPDSAMANLFTDPAESARMRLFLRYQTSVQREYDTAIRELRKEKANRAEHSLENAWNARMRAIPTTQPKLARILTTPAAEKVGFASQTPANTPSQSQPTHKASAA